MKNCIALITVGLMLSISIAASAGIGNHITVSVHKEAEGNCATGAVLLFQDVDVAANVEGNYNNVEQNVDLYANFNDLEGTEGQPTTLTQQAVVVGNVTGNGNNLNQNLLMNACNNDLTSSNLSQRATQKADILGSYNDVSQSTYVDSHDNVLILSNLDQLSAVSTLVNGNYNIVDSSAEQYVECDSLTGSKEWQLIDMPSLVAGSYHNLTQHSSEFSKRNIFTAGAVKGQKISATAVPFGAKNAAIHNITLKETNSSMTGSTFIQESNVISKV